MLRNQQAEVREIYKRFDTNPRLWEEYYVELEAEGWKFNLKGNSNGITFIA